MHLNGEKQLLEGTLMHTYNKLNIWTHEKPHIKVILPAALQRLLLFAMTKLVLVAAALGEICGPRYDGSRGGWCSN